MNVHEEDQDLTIGEIQELEATSEALRDVYGTANGDPQREGESMPSAAVEQLNEALKLVPDDQRQAYDEAMRECPHLVAKESKPELFLRVCASDPWAAAKRLCTYWQWRKELFGDRAFRPMDITGHGAVPEDIVEAIKCGGTTCLPPDSRKRVVIYSDRCRFCSRCADEDARVKVIFYVFHTLMESELAVQNGYVGITKMDSNSNAAGARRNAVRSKAVRLLESGAIPLTPRGVHILVSKNYLLESTVPLWLKVMGRFKFLSLRTVAHFAESREAMFNDLKNYCFEAHNIPTDLGGTLDFDEYFEEWLAERLKLELARRPYCQEAKSRDDIGEGAQTLEGLAVVADQVRVEEARARKRKLDAIYQKKKRQQRKDEFFKVSRELNALKKDNVSLKEEQASLELLVHQAIQVARSYERSTSASEVMAIPQPRTVQPPQSQGLSQLFQGCVAPLPTGESPRTESIRGLGGLDRSFVERMASFLQAGSVPQDLLTHGDLLQKLQSTLLLQQMEEREMEHRQNQQQHVQTGPMDQAAIHRLAILLYQQQQGQQQPKEPSEIARYLQQARARIPTAAAAPNAMTRISGFVGQQQQHGQVDFAGILPSQMYGSTDKTGQANHSTMESLLSRVTFPPVPRNTGHGGHVPTAAAAAPVSNSLQRTTEVNGLPPQAFMNDRDKALQLYEGLNSMFQLGN